ncbi:3364_t:CDS:1, partial [Racocetra persica]
TSSTLSKVCNTGNHTFEAYIIGPIARYLAGKLPSHSETMSRITCKAQYTKAEPNRVMPTLKEPNLI